jgi:ribonuclease G
VYQIIVYSWLQKGLTYLRATPQRPSIYHLTMANELVISTKRDATRIALIKKNSIAAYYVAPHDTAHAVGDIYLGRVKHIRAGLNAAFVDVGHEKDAFIHYADLGKHFPVISEVTMSRQNKGKNGNTILSKEGAIASVIRPNQKIMVQIAKESISSKGLRLSSIISLPGRYLVFMPFGNDITISRRIEDTQERDRLYNLIASIKPVKSSIVVRTVAEGRDVAALHGDLKQLVERWEIGIAQVKKAKVGERLIGELSRINAILRDTPLIDSFGQIIVDNEIVADEMREYLVNNTSKKPTIVHQYKGKTPLFEHLGLERQLKSLFGKTVNLDGGGYLVVEQTEALHSIDVNSGNYGSSFKKDEGVALAVNLKAAERVAQIMQLRDIGGIIIIDFINMSTPAANLKVYNAMKRFIKEDRAKINIYPLTRLGLMQITRERVRSPLAIASNEVCSTCFGTGKMVDTLSIAHQISQQLKLLVTKRHIGNITIRLHPYLYAYFTHGLLSRKWQWMLAYRTFIKLEEDKNMPIVHYTFLDSKGKVLAIQPVLRLSPGGDQRA